MSEEEVTILESSSKKCGGSAGVTIAGCDPSPPLEGRHTFDDFHIPSKKTHACLTPAFLLDSAEKTQELS